MLQPAQHFRLVFISFLCKCIEAFWGRSMRIHLFLLHKRVMESPSHLLEHQLIHMQDVLWKFNLTCIFFMSVGKRTVGELVFFSHQFLLLTHALCLLKLNTTVKALRPCGLYFWTQQLSFESKIDFVNNCLR